MMSLSARERRIPVSDVNVMNVMAAVTQYKLESLNEESVAENTTQSIRCSSPEPQAHALCTLC